MDFSPKYRITVHLPEGAYQIKTLQALNSGLTTALAVGALDATFADPTGQIGHVLGRVANGLPVCLNAAITLECRNVWGEWGTAWSGFITSAGPAFDPAQGFLLKITGGDALKPFAVQTQSAGSVAALTISSLSNVSASAVLTYAAKAIGFPSSRLLIHVKADAGSGIQTDIPPATFLSPQQSSWLAVLNGVAQFTGNILFADEVGRVVYRPIDYQAPPVRSIPKEVVHQYALASSDEELATHVEVRYGLIPLASAAPVAPAPGSSLQQTLAAWDKRLGQRQLITYMPWIQTRAAATWAAGTLLQQGMAQLGVGQVTIIGDHAYHVGDTVRLPWAGKDAFIQQVTQQWQWGGSWLTTLGLTFVRERGSALPTYVGPTAAQLSGLPKTSTSVQSVAAQQAADIAATGTTAALTLQLTATSDKTKVPAGYNVAGPASTFRTGSQLIMVDDATNGPVQLGTVVAKPTVYAAASVPAGVLYTYAATQSGQTETVRATTVTLPGPQQSSSPLVPPPDPLDPAKAAIAKTQTPAADSGSTAGRYVPASAVPPMANKVVSAALTLVGSPYTFAGSLKTPEGIAYSCVALIGYAMSVSLFARQLAAKYPDSSAAKALNGTPQIYDQHVLWTLPGNTKVALDQAQTGDLLFFSGTGGAWAGQPPEMFTHAALVLGLFNGGPDWVGGTLPCATAMVTSNSGGSRTGVVVDNYESGYWLAHSPQAMRPDYAPA